MSTKIRLMRLGKIRTPFYRIVVIDSKKARNGLSIEEIGRYVPGKSPSLVEVNSERAQHWLKVGAQPSAAVTKLDRKSTRLNSSHVKRSRMPSSA